jgi:hypothetical protein
MEEGHEMRYATWKLTWVDGYGYGPEQTAADNGGRLEASSFASPDVMTGTILGYLTGDVDLDLLSDWAVTELTAEEALVFAQTVSPDAFFTEGGRLTTPPKPEPVESA